MKSRILAMIIVTAMLACFTGCGAKEEKITLTIWSPSEDQSEKNGKWLQTMCEKFDEEHPEWDIEFTYGVCPEGDAKEVVTQDVESAADVYMFANDNLKELIASNALAKLGGTTETYVKQNMSEEMADSVAVDGYLYGVPFTPNTWFMYYNKSLVDSNEATQLETLLEKGKVAFPLSDSWYIAAFYAANGCSFFGGNNNEEAGIDFGGEKAVKVTEYLVDMAAHPNFVNDTAGEGLSGMANKSVVAMFSGSWDYQNVANAIGAENVGATQLPTILIEGENKSLKAFYGSKAIGVNPSCDNMEVAVALAAYLGGEEAQRAHYEMRKIIPTNLKVLQDEEISSDIVAVATQTCIENTAIMQPFGAAMSNYWIPAENFGKSIMAKEVTAANAAEMTEALNKSINSSVVD